MCEIKIAAIVLTWNNFNDTAECIQSLQNQDYEELQIIIVDNGSSDDSAQQLESEFPNVNVIYAKKNHGFGGGMNIGIKEALSKDIEHIWLLNNDVVCHNNQLLSTLVNRLELYRQIGAISPVINYYQSSKVWFHRGIIDEYRGDAEHTRDPLLSSSYDDDLVLNDYVPTACVLYRRSVFEEVGLFPEKYFLYYEDVEHCHSMKNHYDIVTDSTVTAAHKKSASTGGSTGAIYLYYVVRNRWLFATQNLDVSYDFYIHYLFWLLTLISKALYHNRSAGLKLALALLQGGRDALLQKTGRGPYP